MKKSIYYTYLIGWSEHNKLYYGVRYSKHATLDELWVKYKTSSKYVKDFYEKYGDPDIIQIRKVFNTKEEAIAWESKVLKRMRVVESDVYLNRWDNNTVPYKLDGPFPFEDDSIQDKVNDTLIEKYGERGSAVPAIREKVMRTNTRRYGTHHTLGCAPVATARLKKIKERYGVDNPFCNNEELQKVMLERYGVTNMMFDPTVRDKHQKSMKDKDWRERNEKTKKTNIRKYGKSDILNTQEIRERNKRPCPHGCKDNHPFDAGNFTNHMVRVHGWTKQQINEYKYANKKN